jgi:hypothetical protein
MRIEKKTTKAKKGKNEFIIDELNAKDAPVENVRWHGQEIDTSQKIEDPGTGRPIILRTFDFDLPKDIPSNQLPNKTQLMTFHRSKIIAFLWKDELELIQEPKIVKINRRKFKIFAVCQAKKGSIISQQHLNEMKPLQDIIQQSVHPTGNTK